MKIGTKDPKEVPQELDIALDLEYSGGCHMAIQVDLVFSKSVYIAVKLAHLRGRARLQFSRHPLTHWSLAFYEVKLALKMFWVEMPSKLRTYLWPITIIIVFAVDRGVSRQSGMPWLWENQGPFSQYFSGYSRAFSFQ